MKKKISILLCLMLIITTITACSNENEDKVDNNTEVGTENNLESDNKDKTGGEFIFSQPKDVTLFDPKVANFSYDYNVIYSTHDGLVRMDYEGNIHPQLAESWKLSDDMLEYTFYLREGVTFQDGTPFTANDVKFSWDRAKETTESKRFTYFMDEIEVVSDYEVKLKLNQKMHAALNFLTLPNNCIVSEKIVNEIGEDEYRFNPCGTGPFKLDSWEPGGTVYMSANEDYFLGRPKLDKLTFKTIKEDTTSVIALEKGEVDAIMMIPAVMKQTIIDNDKLEYKEQAASTYMSLFFNNEMAPFDDVLVRRAIYKAINPQEIIDIALGGHGIATDIALHPATNGYVPGLKRIHEFNIEEAKELLKQAGFPDGFKTEIYSREDEQQKISQVIQQQLAKIGVDVDIIVMEKGALQAEQNKGNLPMFYVGNSDLALDAELPLSYLISSGIGSTNHTRFSNEEYDKLFEELSETIDQEKRLEIIEELLTIELEETPRVPLYFPIANIANNKKFKNVKVGTTTAIHYFYDVYIEE